MRKIEVIPQWRDVVSLRGLRRLTRIILILVTGIGAIGLTAWVTKPPELPPDIIIIRPLPVEDNPYQREYDEMLKPAVMITTLIGRGTGVIISSSLVSRLGGTPLSLRISSIETYILTAAHVVGNYSEVTVTIYTPLTPLNRGESLSASVVLTDTAKDLALLRVLCAFVVKSAQLAPKDYVPYLFTPVWVVGCSLGLAPRPSFGHITAITSPLNSPFVKGDLGGCWEVSAPILPGNSGGPVYDAGTHELIGIAVWVRLYNDQLVTTMAGIVPIQTVYEFLDLATKTPSH